MNTVTNELSGCPSGHVWCQMPHHPGDYHRRLESLTVGASTVVIDLYLEGDEDADPKMLLNLQEWDIAFSDMGDEVSDLNRLAASAAARLTWFTVGIEALKGFKYSTQDDGDGLLMHEWELPASGNDHGAAHYINFDAEEGFRISSWAPAEVMSPDQFDSWHADVRSLQIAAAFLIEVTS